MISALGSKGLWRDALELLSEMRSKGIERDGTTSTPRLPYPTFPLVTAEQTPTSLQSYPAHNYLCPVVVFNAAIDSISKRISLREWAIREYGTTDEINRYIAKIFDLLAWMDHDGIVKDDYTYDTVCNHTHQRPTMPNNAQQRLPSPTNARLSGTCCFIHLLQRLRVRDEVL
jgi:pentatricopeptide repeat protein